MRRAAGNDPTHTEEARRRQRIRAPENDRANAEWGKLNGANYLNLDFERDTLPGLRQQPLSAIMKATGLSLRHSPLIRWGMKVPHPRHWAALAELQR
jgi:hypothetical protein